MALSNGVDEQEDLGYATGTPGCYAWVLSRSCDAWYLGALLPHCPLHRITPPSSATFSVFISFLFFAPLCCLSSLSKLSSAYQYPDILS